MSGALKIAGTVAGVVAIGFATAASFGVAGVALGLTAAKIGAIAGVASAVANAGAQLTASAPPARGAVNDITIGANQPTPYLIGRTYYGGSRIRHVGYGQVNKHINPYLHIVDVYSGAGPVDGLEAAYLDFAPVPLSGNAATGHYANHLYVYHQRGLTPEPGALSTHWAGAPRWSSAHKLSGYAAIAWCMRFDADGKRFTSGVPQTGAVWRGVWAYDPRQDSTYPGGSGAQRQNNRATWAYSQNPGIHALTYALGCWMQGRKVFGPGITFDGIEVADFVELANVCDANGWKVGGVIFEGGPNAAGVRYANLKDILYAGGAEPSWIGGRLGLKISAPRIALDTITEDDLANDDVEIGAMQGWEDRLNTLIPKYRSEAHKWEYVASSPVTIPAYVEEDGEEKTDERQGNLVQWKDQQAQLCAYELVDRRELGEIVLTCKPRLRRYSAGDLLIVDLPNEGLVAQPAVILKKTFNPLDMTTTFVLRGETMAKHDFALGRVGTAPPTPALTSGETLDDLAGAVMAEIVDLVSDAVLTRGKEKQRVIIEHAAINDDFTALDDRYDELGTPSDITPSRNIAATQLGLLNSYLAALSPAWNDVETDTPVDPVTFSARWRDANEAMSVFRAAITGRKGEDGVSAYAILLTNENHILPADADGSVMTYNGAATDVVIYSAGVDVTDQFALSVAANPQALAVTLGARTATVTGGLDIGELNAVLILRMTGSGDFAGVVLEKVFSLTKSRAGADGSSPALVSLSASPQIVRYDGSGNILPSQTVDFIASRQNTAQVPVFRFVDSAGVELYAYTASDYVASSPEFWQSDGPDHLSMTPAGLALFMDLFGGATGQFTMRASIDIGGLLFDSVTVHKVRDGRNGDDGLPGTPGADGQTWYPYYAYANAPDGSVDFTTGAPGNRAYVGFATGTSPSEPTLPGLYAWSEYKGPPFGLATTGPAFVAGSSIIRRGGSVSWEAQAYSTVGYRNGATTSFSGLGTQDVMAGLNTDPTANASFDTLDHAWYLRSDGVATIYEDGNQVAGPFFPGYGSGMFTVDYDGQTVRYSYNGIIAREIEVGPDKLFYFDSSFGNTDCRLNNVQFGPRGAIGAPGANAPLVLTQWSIDGVTAWHPNYFGGDRFYRQSNDNGATWGPAILGVGENGIGPQNIFRRSQTVPATPGTSTGNPPAGWSDGPPAGTDFLWLSTADYRAGTQVTAWSAPQRISGEDGADGFNVKAIPAAVQIPVVPNGTPKPSWTGGSVTIELRKGEAVIAATSYAVESVIAVTNIAVSGNVVTFTGLGLDGNGKPIDKGEFTIVATLGGVQYRDKVIVQRTYDGSPAFRSTVNFNGPAGNGTTTVPGGREVRLAASGFIAPGGNPGSFAGYIDLYYRNVTDNGVEVYAGRSVTQTATRTLVGEEEGTPIYSDVPASVGIVSTFTSPTNDKQFSYRALIGGTASGGIVVAYSGTVSLEVVS